ncbi:MAG: PhoU domain-containing protein [Candidatus Bathyarchaeia archaeon]
MEQRKVMSLGRSSLVISLPKHWTKLNELKQGDVVSLAVQRDRSLVVFPGTGRKKWSREITLHIDPDERTIMIVRSIIACYLNGYSGIRLVSKKIFPVTQQRAIRRIVRILYMRIMESDAKNMHIVTLIDESKASVISGIQRMHKIANSMCRDALNSLRDQDATLAKTVYSLDDDVDHFSFFILRLLRRAALDPALANQLGIEPIDCLDLQTLVHRIEQVADNASNIAKHIIMLNQKRLRISDPLLELMLTAGNNAINCYSKAVEAFLSKDTASSDEIIEREKFIEKLDREIASWAFLHEKKNPIIICATCSIRESIQKTAEHAADIAEITIDRSYKPPS